MENWEQVFYVEKGEHCYYSSNGKPYTGGGIANWLNDLNLNVNDGNGERRADVVLVEFIGPIGGSYGYIKENLRLATEDEIRAAHIKESDRRLSEIKRTEFTIASAVKFLAETDGLPDFKSPTLRKAAQNGKLKATLNTESPTPYYLIQRDDLIEWASNNQDHVPGPKNEKKG